MQFLQKDILREDVYYDCLLCIDVFEHVEDCFGFLRGLKSKADYKVFHIPLDISVLAVLRGSLMKWRKNVGHVHYFTLDTALALVKDCGYEIIDGFYTNKFADLEPSTWKGYLASFPRKVLLKISPKWLALILGGPSYIVLAR